MKEVLKVDQITKIFNISEKQRRIEHTKEKLRVAVNQLSFSAYEGEIFGLLGPNGAGKTTALRIISTLIKPDEGDVFVYDHSVVKDANEVRKHIGFLTSELKLEDFFTPSYLFDYFANLHGVKDEDRWARKEYLFAKFGIDKFAEVKVSELSTGMKQKASIAISLVHDPDIIIFDEPTNGLDVLTAKVVTDYLMELKNKNKTIIISTHIFDLIEKVCDRVGIIIEGKMVLCDTLDNVCQKQDLETVFFNLYKDTVGER